jgi:hypothetical protein
MATITKEQFEKQNEVIRMDNMVLFAGHAIDMINDALNNVVANEHQWAQDMEKMRNKLIRIIRQGKQRIDEASK